MEYNEKSGPAPSHRSVSTDEDHNQKHEFDDTNPVNGQQKKKWYKKLNPLYFGDPPPVPAEDAGLVPDLQAGWWGKLTWGWMGSLMMVCLHF
jgi:hypothetical protein